MKPFHFLKTVAAPALTIAAAIQMAVLASPAHAGIVYDYDGNPFTTGRGPPTNFDKITGFVEFGSQPAPGATDVSNVVGFSFTASTSPLFTFDNTSAGVGSDFSFDFDGSGNIVAWGAAAATAPLQAIFTCMTSATPIAVFGNTFCNTSDVVDQVRSMPRSATSRVPGTWTKRPVDVPSPASLPLFLVGLVALAMLRRLTRP